MAGFYQAQEVPPYDSIPWTPLDKPLSECRIALVTTAGLYIKDEQQPFDLDRERREPAWGDPTYRVIPANLRQDRVGVAHLHINTEDIERDVNVVLPVDRMRELAGTGEVGSLAPSAYSFMGYQENTDAWLKTYVPELSRRMIEEQVDVSLVTPA
jgi:D-proline reductase (dithiol) PrdB